MSEITLFDEIGAAGATAVDFERSFRALPGREVTLLLNSPGGSVLEALTICNVIVSGGKTVKGKVMGMAGSAASFIAAACHTLEMPENTFQFLHDPIGALYGDADDHRAYAEMLDKIGGPLVAMYVKRSGQSEATIRKLLKDDSLLTAAECLELGLCDRVTTALPP